MSLQQAEKNKHLLWRAGFGPATDQLVQSTSLNEKDLFKKILQHSEKYTPLKVSGTVSIADMLSDKENATNMQASETKRREARKQSAENIKKLNLLWMDEMTNSNAQLLEKISLFWHGHFACRSLNYYQQEILLNTIRQNALGNFGDLLKAVSKTAAMLQFLNNQQNRKQQPNENFAREVMELFTMGRGNYTEQDVKEAARAFTGWGFNVSGEFVFRNFFHDDGSKTVLSKSGNFDGDDVLNILLEQQQTALFITKKIYKYFVNETIHENNVAKLADKFYASNYDIKKLMENIFTADWFYDQKNIGAKIKSPVDLMVGMRRNIPINMQIPEMQLLLQKALGQVLFYPPNVAGWPGGYNWIDSSTLMTRLRIPEMLQNETINVTAKTDDDIQMGMSGQNESLAKLRKFKEGASFASVDWISFTEQFKKIDDKDLYTAIQNALLQTNKKVDIVYAGIGNGKQSKEAYIQSTVIALMRTPEYQMC